MYIIRKSPSFEIAIYESFQFTKVFKKNCDIFPSGITWLYQIFCPKSHDFPQGPLNILSLKSCADLSSYRFIHYLCFSDFFTWHTVISNVCNCEKMLLQVLNFSHIVTEKKNAYWKPAHAWFLSAQNLHFWRHQRVWSSKINGQKSLFFASDC